jgi:predicted nucleotide-binding protein
LDDLNRYIVEPYVSGQEVYLDGRHIAKSKIRALKIKSSNQRAEELVSLAYSELSPGVFINITKERAIQDEKYVTDVTKEIISSVGDILRSGRAPAPQNSIERNKVFIVHGRDELAKTEAARFIEKLKLTPIILHEQASGGKTIIEKIESFTNVGFAIVLYTPCDVGGLKNQSNPRPRARQNVVFEHGFLIGKLGRDRVCALVKENVETPNDINGVVYISLDARGAWRYEVAKELRQAGYPIDMNSI